MEKKELKAQTILIPLPAAMVSCQWGNRPPNIITCSWIGILCSEPPMLGVGIRKSRFSHKIITESMEFGVNITTENLVEETDYCGTFSGKDFDKFREANLTPFYGKKIKAPMIKECPINLECLVRQVIELGSHDFFIAEIVSTYVDEEFLDEKEKPDIGKLKPLVYCTKAQEYWGLSHKLGGYGYTKKKGK